MTASKIMVAALYLSSLSAYSAWAHDETPINTEDSYQLTETSNHGHPDNPNPDHHDSSGHHDGQYHHPAPTHGGSNPWNHWPHPPLSRPTLNFNWALLRKVTCTAVDSKNIPYAVMEDRYEGVTFRERINEIQDAAIDRCYSESNGDVSCALAYCTAGY